MSSSNSTALDTTATGHPMTEQEMKLRALVFPPAAQVKGCPHCDWCVLDTDPLSVYPAIRLEAHIKDRHTVQPTTPTPWIFDGGVKIGPPSGAAGIDVDVTEMVALVYGQGNATLRGNANLIVKAVNNHARLVDVLLDVADLLNDYSDVNDGDDGRPVANRAMSLLEEVRAVLARVEGRA